MFYSRQPQQKLYGGKMENERRARLDLELILPYVNHLKNEVNQDLRIERRKEQAEQFRDLQDKSIFDESVNYFRETYGTTKK